MSRLLQRRSWTMWIPALGVVVFVVLYLCSAALYPGGTRVDHATRGYSHVANYWCDLLDGVSYSGQLNRGQPLALLATVLLPLSLIPFWLYLPCLFPERRWAGGVVRLAGLCAMSLASLVFTRHHDLVINIAAPLGFAAFLTGLLGLARARQRTLLAIGLLALAFAVANYLMWQLRWFLAAMPLVQKGAYLSFFGWIVATSIAIRRQLGECPAT